MSLHLLVFCAVITVRIRALAVNSAQLLTLDTNLSTLTTSSNISLLPSLLNNNNGTLSTNLLLPSQQSINQTEPSTNRASYECHSLDFGKPHFTSCMSAYKRIPGGANKNVLSYGSRDLEDTYDVLMPQQYVSGMSLSRSLSNSK